MSTQKMAVPTFRYHKEHGAKLFDAAVEDMEALAEQGWFDNPNFEVSKQPAVVVKEVGAEELNKRLAELEKAEKQLALEREAFEEEKRILAEQLAEFEAGKAAFNDVVMANQDQINNIGAQLASRFVEDPKSLTVQELYTYGKAIGAKVHHKHNEDRLIEVIQEHIGNDHG